MTKIDRRAHDREAEAVAHRRTWKLVAAALLATIVVVWAIVRALF